MFDYVRCVYPLPDGRVNDSWKLRDMFQTKCLGYAPDFPLDWGPDLNLYEIMADGRLMLLDKSLDYTSSPSGPRTPVAYTGTMDFYGGPQDDRGYGTHREYRAYFTNGVVAKIATIPEPLTPEQQAEEDRKLAEWNALPQEERARLTEEANKRVAEGMAQMIYETAARPGFMRRFLERTANDPRRSIVQKKALKRKR